MTVRLRVDLQALAANYRKFRAAAAGEVGAVVKADAYGMGVLAVARALFAAGCRHFFVARAGEGVELRRGLATPRIYVFEGALPETVAALAEHGLTPVLNSLGQLSLWRPHCRGSVAVHVDTGMNRLGFPADVGADAFKGHDLSLLVTHLACADEPEHPLNALQARRIKALRMRFPGVPLSIGNSAGVLNGGDFQGDLARPGIGLYGGNPWTGRPNPMRTVAALEAQVVQMRSLAANETVGYGASYRAAAPLPAAVVGIGYADGLPRALSNCGEFHAAERRCPIIGRVSMDLTTIGVAGANLNPGNWVEVFGPNISVDEVAEKAGTAAYEIFTGVSPRVRRIYQ